jgi:hypothetical protein
MLLLLRRFFSIEITERTVTAEGLAVGTTEGELEGAVEGDTDGTTEDITNKTVERPSHTIE